MKPLLFFRNKFRLALDICFCLNPSGDQIRLERVAKLLARRYTRLQLSEIWIRSNKQFFEYLDFLEKKWQ